MFRAGPRVVATLVVAMLVAGSCGLSAARAAEIEGVRFAEGYRIGETRFILQNVGLVWYRAVVKAMVAALYLPDGVEPAQALSDVPKRMELEYFWALKGNDIRSTSEKLLAQNLSSQQRQQMQEQIERLHALYEDIEAGDRYSLTYIPGAGMQLALNGQPKGTVEGAEFAAAYFAIWLGPKPMDAALKQTLLTPRAQ